MMSGAFARRAIACLVLLGVPAVAAAQPPPEAPADQRPTYTVGPVAVRPRLLFNNIGVDDNVFNERENPKSDWTFSAQPDVEFSLRPGRARLVWLSGAEFVYYRRYETERSINRSQSLSAEYDLNVLRPFVTYTTAHTSARPNAEIDLRARRHPRAYSVGSMVKLASRFSGTLLLRKTREEYDGGVGFREQELAETLNHRGTIYEGSVAFQATPITSLSVVMSHERLRFDHAPLRDSRSIRIAPTVTFTPFGLLNGTASVGVRKFEGESAALPGYTGVVMNGTLSSVLLDRFRLDTRFTRDVQYSYEESLPFYVLSGGRATLAAQMTDRFDLRVTAGHDRMNYRAFAGESDPGADTMNLYGGGIGFYLGDRTQLVLQTEFTERSSGRDRAREFRNRRIFATMTWGV
jgi:hypothetical protein